MSRPTTHTDSSHELTCREVIDFIMAYLDGELAPGQRFEFERHLGTCPSCVNYLNSYQSAVRLGKHAMQRPDDPPVPEDLIKAIRDARSSNP